VKIKRKHQHAIVANFWSSEYIKGKTPYVCLGGRDDEIIQRAIDKHDVTFLDKGIYVIRKILMV